MATMTKPHTHPCAHCAAPVQCDGTLEPNHDGLPEVICTTYHRPGGGLATFRCQRCELLIELADYFDNRMDINNDGGPNDAMVWHRRIMEVLE